ncbi:MAG: ABC transporter permease, partial [Bryobacteraceae bacterium]
KTVTAVAAVSLALGIGSTTSVFRLVEAAFLRPLAIRDADRLYFLRYTAVNIDGKESEKDSFSYPELLVMRDALKDRCELLMVSFADRQDVTYGDPAAVEKISRQFVSGRLFEDFGLQAAAGRLFSRAEDESSADHRIAVISFPYWQRRFGLDPTIIGKTFRYQGDTYTIAGVVERGFTGTSTGSFTDVFLPLLANTEATRSARSARWAWARILVHLNRDASVEGVRDRVAGCDRSDCACLVCSGGGRASHPRHPLGSGADAALGINSL